MKFPHFPRLKSSGGWACSTVPSLIAILAALLSLQKPCQAQQPLASQWDVSANPLNDISWFSGPQKVTLGDFADINIPAGFRLTDVHGARTILASIGDAIPDDLVGVLAPVSGKWMAILEYSPVGYVKNPDVTQINTTAVLKEVLNQIKKQEPSSVPTLSWQSKPAYDANRHLLACALKLETPTSKILNQTAVMFGRRGVVQVTVAQPSLNAGAPSLMQLVGNISFKPGERYADYRNGDKVAEIALGEIILDETHPQTAGFFSGGFGSVVAWTYGGLALCLLTGGVMVVRRRSRRSKTRRRAGDPVPAPALKDRLPISGPSPKPPPATLKNSGFIGPVQPKPVLNRSYLAKPFRRRRRKRIFNYSKFYQKLLKNLSGHAYGPPVIFNSKSHSNGHTHANGHSNGDSGNANVHSNGHGGSIGSNVNQLTSSELQELIATQKSLIQEQKCLLEHQTRLIEEKRRLIDEQIAVLKTQSGLAIDPQDYPLKIAQ